MGRKAQPIEERFWNMVDKRGDAECWLWLGGSVNGYGKIRGDAPESKMKVATHVSLELAGRPLKEGECALHECDNPPCVNPKHLFAGTKTDNHEDKMAKGRHRAGPTRAGGALTAQDAAQIRRRALAGCTHAVLAAEFGISTCHVSKIRNNQTWKDAA